MNSASMGADEDVLIETLWNVKFIWFEIQNFPKKRINRNIMECKGGYSGKCGRQGQCINRNIMECKVSPFPDVPAVWQGINRNIMECKVAFFWYVSSRSAY